MINHEWIREKLVPVLWLWFTFAIIGAMVGLWLRSG